MTKQTSKQHQWGLLPEQVIILLQKREWDNRRTLKSRLNGQKPFPISIGLKPPKGNTALADLTHFQCFIDSWKKCKYNQYVQWKSVNYRQLSNQSVPTHLIIPDIETLAALLGDSQSHTLKQWIVAITRLRTLADDKNNAIQNTLFNTLIEHLEFIHHCSPQDIDAIIQLVPQLFKNMGVGNYLRALPVIGIDSKFIETNEYFIESITDVLHEGSVKESGGLVAWLNCHQNPSSWLMIRPLCEVTRAKLGNLPLLKMDTETLQKFALPAQRILVVENIQSGLALPTLDNTIAVIGGGKNIVWMNVPWLQSKQVGYWGDIDSEGLAILSNARKAIATVQPLMMDEQTLKSHLSRMVDEPTSLTQEPEYLTAEERLLFNRLQSQYYQHSRLEQERLSIDFIYQRLQLWTDNTY